MPYCTQGDIINLEMTEDELITLTDDPDIGEVTTVMVDAAIAKGDAEIDAYCQGTYSVPFADPAPVIVNGWSATLAAFNLYRNRPKPATLIDRYNKVMSWLSDIQKGNKAIAGVDESDVALPASTTDGMAQIFRKTQRDTDGNLMELGTMDTW